MQRTRRTKTRSISKTYYVGTGMFSIHLPQEACRNAAEGGASVLSRRPENRRHAGRSKFTLTADGYRPIIADS
jgi:hypothetical protein